MIYAIGDPLAAYGNHKNLINAFIKAFPEAIFIQCSDVTARHLRNKDYYVNLYGVETELQLASWQCQGRKSHMLRKQRKKSEKSGIVIEEISDNPDELLKAKQISDQWLTDKKSTAVELKMLTRPPIFAIEKGTRKFAAYCENTMIGIAFFDPLNLCSSDKGFVFQIVRTAQQFSGTGTHLLLHAAEVFRHEGMEIMSLGGSPLALRAEPMQGHSPATRLILNLFKSMSSHAYDYEGLEFYKSRFNGLEKPIYFCSRHWLPIRGLIGLATETGMARLQLSKIGARLRRLNPLHQRRTSRENSNGISRTQPIRSTANYR